MRIGRQYSILEILYRNPIVSLLNSHFIQAFFGNNWWDFAVIGVSFWSFSQVRRDSPKINFDLLLPFTLTHQEDIDDREEECINYPDSCKDEAWFMREINAQLKEKFEQDRNFSYCFTDSWSQTAGHIDDPTEQAHWTEETDKLWEVTNNRTSQFSFRTIDDILEENAAAKAEIRWLNDVITENITKLATQIQANHEDITSVSEEVSSVR